MKRILIVAVFCMVVLAFPSGTVAAQSICPTEPDWTCKSAKFPTIGEMIVVNAEFPIQKLWIDGTLYTEDVNNEIFYIVGIGTTEVKIFSDKVSMQEVGIFAPAPITPTVTSTAAPTVTPTTIPTATPTVTSTTIPTVTPTAIPTVTRINWIFPISIATGILLVVVFLIARKKK